MSTAALNRRVAALENSAPVIATLADFVLWHAHGCPEPVEWDPRFRALFPKAAASCKARAEDKNIQIN